ncbi:GNAT family N-acetyltransferase [Lentisphaera marina]|uniref:GNAT family N-acetyltransferase n=1 Tax=Lentisphaera marina TaxID=1111041 RepID=UPI0023667253|nr:GNAT family N-acetyltransferase [Lentisphaera marina]MDD7986889.1 GNAT family N-acetyltransferase [Lentisphaera marina]
MNIQLTSKNVKLRLIVESDAQFILELRLNDSLNRYLSEVDDNLNRQIEWIKNYKIREALKKEFYFIIENNRNELIGSVRLYDFLENSFSWGSWILNNKKSPTSAIESALLVYQFGFNNLSFQKSHFEVMKANKNVISFHEKWGAHRTGENEEYFFYEISAQAVNKVRQKFNKLL